MRVSIAVLAFLALSALTACAKGEKGDRGQTGRQGRRGSLDRRASWARLDPWDRWGHPARRGIPEPADLEDFEVPKATQERKAMRVTPAPPGRRVPPAMLVQLA